MILSKRGLFSGSRVGKIPAEMTLIKHINSIALLTTLLNMTLILFH